MEIQRYDSLHQRYCYRNMCPPKNSSHKAFDGIVKGVDMKFSGGGPPPFCKQGSQRPSFGCFKVKAKKNRAQDSQGFPLPMAAYTGPLRMHSLSMHFCHTICHYGW